MEKDSKKTAEVLKQKFTIGNKMGLHARPAALLVQTVNRFHSEVTIQKGKQKVNAKSIMGVMMLAAGIGSHVEIRASGPDARKVMMEIAKLFDTKFGEE